MSVKVTYEPTLTVVETSELGLDGLTTAATITSKIDSGSTTFSGTTSPDVQKSFAKEISLVAGVAVLDLTALDKGDLPNEDWSGLRLEFLKMLADPANTGPEIEIDQNITNPYPLFGAASNGVSLKPGQEILMKFNGTATSIGAGVSEIEFAGAGADKIKVQLVAG